MLKQKKEGEVAWVLNGINILAHKAWLTFLSYLMKNAI